MTVRWPGRRRWWAGGLLVVLAATSWLYHGRGVKAATEQIEAPTRSVLLRTEAGTASPRAPGTVEAHLEEVLASLQQSDLDGAYAAARQLTERFPTHALSQLMLSDVSRMQSFELPLLATGGESVPAAKARRLDEMRTEAVRRMASSPGDVSDTVRLAPILAWSGRTPYVVVVDAKVSRLYLLKVRSVAGADHPVFDVVERLYVSFGKNGLDKRREGDGRTPLGLYRIVGRRTDAELPPLYGHGALTLNYPNPVDVMQGRTGSGIWLHGVPPDQYVRPPFSSDGCIVLANPDFQRLFDGLDLRGTPVVVAQEGLWADVSDAGGAFAVKREALQQALQALQSARTAADPAALQSWVHPSSREPWLRLRAAEGYRLGVDGLSLLVDPQQPLHALAEFHETVNGQRTDVVRVQHWWREPDGWRLLRDEVVQGKPSAALAHAGSAKPPVTAEQRSLVSAGEPPVALRQAVEAWARAWSRSDFDAYLQAYATSFKPAAGLSREAWVQERRARIVGRTSIEVKLSQLQFDVDGAQAVVRFRQDYRSGGLVSSTHKRLVLVLERGRWRIVSEKAGR
ncbi:L,D-transpeptidase family protein [Aquabacterium sp. A08]|uniref:L,D-transpeptidase family protein n=1 Tax=Aquabacterium sp. A08 TaxID=2718532 RepID=UPI00141E83F8|nr:L,D-transpeptidase family protein [Aquabacterium sp. A08]NIC40988.1 L,D-transpeptidase family protein [Aquabacterium sp. A08]